jgi:hypothetical protein
MLILLPMHASATAVFKAERAQRCLPIRRLNISPQTNCNALAYVHVNINGNQMQRRETRGACRGLASILDARVALRSLLGIILIHTHTHILLEEERESILDFHPRAPTRETRGREHPSGVHSPLLLFRLLAVFIFYLLFDPGPLAPALCVCALRIDRQRRADTTQHTR